MNEEVRKNYLHRLINVICEDFQVDLGQFYSRHTRGRVSRARHVFVLVAHDNGFLPREIEGRIRMHSSFVAQVLRRNYKLRQTTEYIHANGVVKGWMAHNGDLKMERVA